MYKRACRAALTALIVPRRAVLHVYLLYGNRRFANIMTKIGCQQTVIYVKIITINRLARKTKPSGTALGAILRDAIGQNGCGVVPIKKYHNKSEKTI